MQHRYTNATIHAAWVRFRGTLPVNAFKWKHFVGEIILQTVREYLK